MRADNTAWAHLGNVFSVHHRSRRKGHYRCYHVNIASKPVGTHSDSATHPAFSCSWVEVPYVSLPLLNFSRPPGRWMGPQVRKSFFREQHGGEIGTQVIPRRKQS